MPVVPWDGKPVFGGKTLVLSGDACRAMAEQMAKRRNADSSAIASVGSAAPADEPDPDTVP